MVKRMSERKEAWFRIIVAIVSGIVIWLWSYLICALVLINWLVVVFSGRRNKGIAEFCEYWNTESYKLSRYMSFMSHKRPFPFSGIERISEFE